MMSRYKIIISSKNLYKEIEITPDTKILKIGTGIECDICLRKEMFFGHVELAFITDKENCSIFCSENLYISFGDARKLLTKQLEHGDSFEVKYQDSDMELFFVSFVIDFDYEKKDYNRKINILDKQQITIGGCKDCDVFIQDEYLGEDYIVLHKEEHHIRIEDINTRYGIYINGKKSAVNTIREQDFFSIVSCSFYYKEGALYTTENEKISVKELTSEFLVNHSTQFDYPKYIRNSRIQYLIPKEEIEIQQPIQKPQKPKKNIVMTLIPALIMLSMTIVLRGILGGGGTFVIYSAVSMSIGVVMSVVSFLQEKKEYRKTYLDRIESYNKYINEKRKTIEEYRQDELRLSKLTYESIDHSVIEAMRFGKKLFERSNDDVDFLQVYLGKGKVESLNQVKYSKIEFVDLDDELVNLPKEVAEDYKYIEDAPIVVNFKSSCGVGVVGNKEQIYQGIKNITIDIVTRHFYTDVKLVYILTTEETNELSWIRWLRNIKNEQLDVRNIVCDDESKLLLMENLYIILSSRENSVLQNDESKFEEHYIVFVTDTSAISSHPVSKYIKNSSKYGFTFVFFDNYEEKIPQGCSEIIRLGESSKGDTLKTSNGDSVVSFKMPEISNSVAERLAIKLAPIYVDEVSLESQLTKNISLFELLGIISVDYLNLKERWQSSEVYKSLSAPLGVKNKNQVVYLDISDRSDGHGPHGLVAGTTGSGKSEILQTYILSMSTLFHPYEVGFVIIDFKGGGMANQFKDLPHLNGVITNIDGREINRSLLSIKAELVKRQEMFSKSGVNHINDYIKLNKAKKVDEPMPHLIIIVDEFAELKVEYPDFMKELISAARIGRTLGVHLILATQKPAGVVDSQIWSNSKFKLCLKVQTKEDSSEVIKTPLAAEIVEPGRAYFQVGNNEIFDLFQSAYSGANIPVGNESNEKEYEIFELNFWGKKTLKYTNKEKKDNSTQVTQLQAVVNYVSDYCTQNDIKKLPGICLPSLNDSINTNSLNYEVKIPNTIFVPIGIYDDPEQQRQGELVFDLVKENVYIVGSAQTGKTVLLQTLIYGLIRKYTPDNVNLYLIDCGSMVLKIFESAAHVGGVVLATEDEKCTNLFKMLNSIVIERKKKLSGLGIGNYASYLEAGYSDMPLIMVAIDNMAAFKEYFPIQSEILNSLSREAQGVGISFVITSATSNAINYRMQSNFSKKVVLNCNDSNEYSSIFGHCKMIPKENVGRGLCILDKKILEYQVAIYGDSKKEAERSQQLIQYIINRNTECSTKAVKIPIIPDKLSLSEDLHSNSANYKTKGIIPIGMDFETVSRRNLDMNASNSLSLIGNTESRESFVINFLKSISRNIVFHNIEAIVIDDKSRALEECKHFGFVKKYTSDTVEALSMISDYCEDVLRLAERELKSDIILLLTINNSEVMKKINADKKESKNLLESIKIAKEVGAFILFANIENQIVGFNAPDVLKAIKEERQAILFGQLSENKIFDISGRIKSDVSMDASIGYHFNGSLYSKIKIFEREE